MRPGRIDGCRYAEPLPPDVRLVEFSAPVTLLLDVLAWGLFHAGTGYLAHRFPARWLRRDWWFLTVRPAERGFYERAARIRRWKDRLPEAGAFFDGGVSKRRLSGRDLAALERFAVETRRAELAHWMATACAPLFVFWNPWNAVVLMHLYAVAVNAPFISVQRYNRLRIGSLVGRTVNRA